MQDPAEERGERICAHPTGPGEPGDLPEGGDQMGRVPEEPEQILVFDLGGNTIVPRREQMHLLGRTDHDAQGCEGMGPGAPELACPRRIVRVGRPPEDEHLEAGGVHAVEQLPSPHLAEPGEVHTAALFESHDPGHTATSNGS